MIKAGSSLEGGRKLQKIAHYSLTGHLLGKGNFARVEEATHSILNFKVAIKIIDTSKIKDAKYVTKNLHREAEILCTLAHPSIMYLYETFQHGTMYFLVSEVAEGGDMCAHIKRQRCGRLDEKTTRRFARQLVSALQHMHERGVVHRDLKMENIMLDGTLQRIKIVDFGLSHSWCPGTILETHCGSPEYAAPELFDADAGYGPEIDLWSIGVVLFGMATGRLPFTMPSTRMMTSGQRREHLLAQVQRGFHSLQERLLMHMTHEFRNVVRLLLTVKITERLNVEGLRCHPWITCRQSSMVADRAYKPLGYQEQDKVITQVSSLLREDPAKVANDIKENCLGKAGGMFNILFHKRSMATCAEERLVSEEIQRVKAKPPPTTSKPKNAPSSTPTASRLAAREPLSFRSKADELNSRLHLANIQARCAAFTDKRPLSTLSPYAPSVPNMSSSRARPSTMASRSSQKCVASAAVSTVEERLTRAVSPVGRFSVTPNSALCKFDRLFPKSEPVAGWKRQSEQRTVSGDANAIINRRSSGKQASQKLPSLDRKNALVK